MKKNISRPTVYYVISTVMMIFAVIFANIVGPMHITKEVRIKAVICCLIVVTLAAILRIIALRMIRKELNKIINKGD
jgi:uncharacterized membrane protein